MIIRIFYLIIYVIIQYSILIYTSFQSGFSLDLNHMHINIEHWTIEHILLNIRIIFYILSIPLFKKMKKNKFWNFNKKASKINIGDWNEF